MHAPEATRTERQAATQRDSYSLARDPRYPSAAHGAAQNRRVALRPASLLGFPPTNLCSDDRTGSRVDGGSRREVERANAQTMGRGGGPAAGSRSLRTRVEGRRLARTPRRSASGGT